jgi:MFS family permease
MWLTADRFQTVFWIAVIPAFLSVGLILVAVKEPELPKVCMPLHRRELGQSIGLPLALVPVVMVIMSLAYSLSAYPVGILSDRMDRTTILIVGLALLILADFMLVYAADVIGVGIGVALWGLHMGFTQGLLATLVADSASTELRGTAFGVFNLITGVALLLASVFAGKLWEAAGPRATFLAGAGFATVTVAGLLFVHSRPRKLEPG